jgi:O-antigen ligase
MTFFVSLEVNSVDKFRRSVKVFLMSAFIVCVWGFLQLLTHYAGIAYPLFLFNNSISEAIVAGPIAAAEGGAARIFSVAPEPSVFARYLLSVLPLAIILLVKKVKVFSGAFTLPCFVLVYILALLLTVSTSAYFGLAFASVAVFFFLKKYRELNLFLKITVLFLLVLGVVIFINPAMLGSIMEMTLYKTLTFSGMERIFAFQEALGLFLAYPLLGVGWGSNASFDLISYLLANSGLLGALGLGLFVFSVYKCFRWLKKNSKAEFEDKVYIDGIGFSLLVGLFLNLVGGFDLVFLHLWFLLGLLIALPKIISQNEEVTQCGI